MPAKKVIKQAISPISRTPEKKYLNFILIFLAIMDNSQSIYYRINLVIKNTLALNFIVQR